MPVVELAPSDYTSTPGAADVDRGSEAPGMLEGLGAGWRKNNTFFAFGAKKDNNLPTHREDGFSLMDKLKGRDLEPDFERFYGIYNTEAFDKRAAQVRMEKKDNETLDKLPWYSRLFLYEGPASVLDWPSLIPGGTLIRGVNGGYRTFRSAATVGSAATAGTAMQEAALYSLQYTRTLEESAFAVGGSFVLGGLIGGGAAGLANRPLAKQARALDRDADLAPARRVFDDIQQKLTDAGSSEDYARQVAMGYAHHYHARAKRLDEAAGDAWKMYQDENITIRRADDGEFVAMPRVESGPGIRNADAAVADPHTPGIVRAPDGEIRVEGPRRVEVSPIRTHSGAEIEVLKNPARADVERLAHATPNGTGETPLRAMRDNEGNVFVWPSALATHEDVGRAVGNRMPRDADVASDWVYSRSTGLRGGRLDEWLPGDRTDKLYQTATIRSGEETMDAYGLNPGESYYTHEVKGALNRRTREKHGIIAENDFSPEALERIARWMVEEVKYELDPARKASSARGWYDEKLQRALDLLGEEFPELLKGGTFDATQPGLKVLGNRENARNFVTALLAVTSDGMKLLDNYGHARWAYGEFRRDGTMPTDFTFGRDRNASMKRNFANIQKLLDGEGAAGMHAFLLQENTVFELSALGKAKGLQFRVYLPKDAKAPMASVVFGPKLGPYYADLMGVHGHLTTDLWWSRTFNRYRGTLIPEVSPRRMAKFRRLLDDERLSDAKVRAKAAEHAKAFERRRYKDGTELEIAANKLHQYVIGRRHDPRIRAAEREFMLATVERARAILREEGTSLSVADIQAILWYYEKRLYAELGAKKTADISYEEAARRVAYAPHYDRGRSASSSGTGAVRETEVADRQNGVAVGSDLGAADYGDRGGGRRGGGGGVRGGRRPDTGRVVVRADPGAEGGRGQVLLPGMGRDDPGGEGGRVRRDTRGVALAHGDAPEGARSLPEVGPPGLPGYRERRVGQSSGGEKVSPADLSKKSGEPPGRTSAVPDPSEAAQRAASSHRESTGFGDEPAQPRRSDPGDPPDKLNQDGTSPRGRIEMSPWRTVITLFRSADQSTFMHESAHLWLKELIADAAHPKAPQQLKDDLAKVLDWLGVRHADKIGVKQHEQWAQGFERYLAEGKAPNAALAGMFEKFRQWLIEVYRSLDQVGVPITDEIREVMGRMLALDGDPGFNPLAIGARRMSDPPPRLGGSSGSTETAASKKAAPEAASSTPAQAVTAKSGLAGRTTNDNAADQLGHLDPWLAANPNPGHDVALWQRMVDDVFGKTRVPMVPQRLLDDIRGSGAVETLKRLRPEQIDAANSGLAQAQEFREAYTSGTVSVLRTGKLILWSMLSRAKSPYAQESMFIDAFNGIDMWIERAAAGRFSKEDLPEYVKWAKSVAPAKSGQPGAEAQGNLVDFGRHFLVRMAQENREGVTHLTRLHEMLSDPHMTGQQIRREFLTFREGSGADNKIISLALQMAGHTDVMVLDRVQIRAMFGDVNTRLYDYRLRGARGLFMYEAIERELTRRIDEIYAAAGRPDGASIARYHWETWQSGSRQAVSHETLAAIIPRGNNSAKSMSDVSARQGEFSSYAYGARYGVDDKGVPYYTYPKLSGVGVHVFSVRAFREFLAEIKNPKSGVVKDGFKITQDGDLNVPWLERQGQGIDRQRLDDIAGEKANPGNDGAGVQSDAVGDSTARRLLGRQAGGQHGRADGGGPSGITDAAPAAEEVTPAVPPQRSSAPPDGANLIPDPTKAADQAALSHPKQAGPTGGNDGKLRSVAAAGMVATGLAATGMTEPGGEAGDNTIAPRIIESLRRLNRKRFDDVGFDASAEMLMKDWNGGLKRALKGTRAAFTEHWKAAGPLDEHEFNEAVGRALRNEGEADDPQVARAARLWRAEVFEPIAAAAAKAGLLPDRVEASNAASYFSRTWSRSKLFAMEREFKDTVAHHAAERMTHEPGGSADGRAKAREIADDLFDTLTGRSDTGSRPGQYPGQDSGLHIPDALAAPFLEDNIERVGRRFVRSIGADLELAQEFGAPDMAGALQEVRDSYARRRARALDENERLALARAERRDIADLESERDRMRGVGNENTIERNYARIVRAAERLDAIRAAGEVGLPSLPDAIRPAMVRGLSAYMQTTDRFAVALNEVTLAPAEAALASKVAERVLAHRLAQLAGVDDPYGSKTPADAFIAMMTDPASNSNGIRIFADMLKSFTAVMAQDRVLRAADGAPDDSIAGQFAQYGETVEGVRVANTPAWDNDDATTQARRAFRAAVNKDTELFAATATGQAMRAVKDFALASWQRLMLRGLDTKAERFMGGLIAMTAIGMFAVWSASPEVAHDPERWIGEGFDRAGIMAVPMELSDAFEKTTGFNPIPDQPIEAGERLLPYNAYPSIRRMLLYALQP
jgi:hypothetical protein